MVLKYKLMLSNPHSHHLNHNYTYFCHFVIVLFILLLVVSISFIPTHYALILLRVLLHMSEFNMILDREVHFCFVVLLFSILDVQLLHLTSTNTLGCLYNVSENIYFFLLKYQDIL